MAIMIPEGIEQFTTDGERQVYNFLGAVAKPDPDYIVRYYKQRIGDFIKPIHRVVRCFPSRKIDD